MLHSKGSVHTEILIVKFTLALPVAAVATVAAVFLTGCGQTGPLYMPKPPNKPAADKPAAELAKPGVAPPSAPVPSTPPASQQ